MPKFLNPYNFIPVDAPQNRVEATQIASGQHTSIRHDAWTPERLSGRIVCALETRAPTAVGAEQEEPNREGGPSRQIPYRRRGNIAIPGNTLRGVVGSALEAISQSSMRVLEDRLYTVRKAPGQALNMIGWLQKHETHWQIVPYCVTSLKINKRQCTVAKSKTYEKIFCGQESGQAMPLCDILPAYIYPRHLTTLDNASSGDALFAETSLNSVNGPVLSDIARSVLNGNLLDMLHSKQTQHTLFILGQRLTGAPEHTDEPPENSNKRQGWYRALGMKGRQEELPPGKKYEYFVPEPLKEYAKPILVDDPIIEKFLKLGEQRHGNDERFPFELLGQGSWRDLQDAMVYFNAEIRNGEPVVTEVSLSSIWRREVKNSVHESFEKIDGDLVPWGGSRTSLTPAEAILGVVSSNESTQTQQLPALKGRVRFFDAELQHEDELPERVLMPAVTLQILSSPKPPSPAMYFYKANAASRYVTKQELAEGVSAVQPAGRKTYLPHRETMEGRIDKASSSAHSLDDSNKQRSRVTPIRKGVEFRFHVDFENLDSAELSLLLNSLDLGPNCVHRIGAGKPLGLGTVHIDAEALVLYKRDFTDYRYSALQSPVECIWFLGRKFNESEPPEEVLSLLSAGGNRRLAADKKPLEDLLTDHRLVDSEALDKLRTLHNPEFVRYQVCYPRTSTQFRSWQGEAGHEEKLFEWFVNNDKPNSASQALGEVVAGEPLPPLDTNEGN